MMNIIYQMMSSKTDLHLLVLSDVDNILALASGDQLVTDELTDYFNFWIGILFLDQLVSLFCYSSLNGVTIHSLLVKRLAKLKLDLRSLKSRDGFDNVGAVILSADLNCWRSVYSKLTDDKADVCSGSIKILRIFDKIRFNS